MKDTLVCAAEQILIANGCCLICGFMGNGGPLPVSQVSIARAGAMCSPVPAAVLALAHNFTAAQNMQEPIHSSISVLDAHAKDAKEHFELARILFKKVELCCIIRLPDVGICKKGYPAGQGAALRLLTVTQYVKGLCP